MAGLLIVEAAVAALWLAHSTPRPPDPNPPAPAVSAASNPPSAIAVGGRQLHWVSLGGADSDALFNRVRVELGAAIADVEQFWGMDWPPEIVVVATGSTSEFIAQAHLDPWSRWADIAAVSVADGVDLVGRRASGQRIVLAPGAAAMSDSALRIVLAHELFHYASRGDTAVDAPRWLTEGVADFVARPPAPLPSGAGRSPELPRDDELDQPGPSRSEGYDRAWWFARFVADSYGVDGLRRLYQQACGSGHTDLSAAIGAALGTDLDRLRAQWAGWLNR